MEQFWKVTSELLTGFETTILLFLFTLVFSLPLGLLISFGTRSRFTPLRVAMKLIVWILRGTPLMLQIFAVFYVPSLLFHAQWPTMNTGWEWFDTTISTRFIAALVAFVINYAAYFSEIFRGGIDSVPRGQYEAGQVLGLTKAQIFGKITFMQVVKRIIPPMSNEIITLVKDTSLANVIGLMELMFWGSYELKQGLLWPIFYTGVFYLIAVGILTLLFGWLEKKMNYYKI